MKIVTTTKQKQWMNEYKKIMVLSLAGMQGKTIGSHGCPIG